jgi:D-serine deaminase-like pyridoxal phosphate-dependent protein
MTITGLNDQHADLRSTPGTEQPVRVVSVSSLSAARLCTTFDRWRHLAMVDV